MWLSLFKYSCVSRQLTKERQLSLHGVSSFGVLRHTFVRARIFLLEVRDFHHAAGFPYIHFTGEWDSVHPMPTYGRYWTKLQTQKVIQKLISFSFYWGHLCNTYFPSAKHSRRTVELLDTWTISGNCTSIFGSYSPITPIKKETLNRQAKSQLFPTKGINYAIWNCNFKSSLFFSLSLLFHDLFCSFWKAFGIAGSPDISLCVFVRCAIGLATKLSEGLKEMLICNV